MAQIRYSRGPVHHQTTFTCTSGCKILCLLIPELYLQLGRRKKTTQLCNRQRHQKSSLVYEYPHDDPRETMSGEPQQDWRNRAIQETLD